MKLNTIPKRQMPYQQEPEFCIVIDNSNQYVIGAKASIY